MKRRICAATIVAFTCLFISSIALASEVPGVSKDTILIGMPGWFTGPGAAYTVPIKQGAELAVKEVNQSGGINGRKIKLIVEDTGYSPKQALAVIRRLVEKDKVFCLVGANVTATTWAMLPLITKYQIPLMEAMASTTILTAPYNKYVFRSMVNHWYLAWLAVDYAAGHLKKKRFALFNVSDTWGVETMKAAKIRLKEKWGLDPVVHAEVPKSATDVGASVLKMKQANPDVLISVGWPRNITPLLRQAKELGLNVPHVGASGADIAEITMAGSYAKDHISHLMTNDLAEGNAPGMKKFRESFAKEYPEVAKGLGRPGLWDAIGYASMHLVADALQKAGKALDRKKYMAALESTKDYTGRNVWMPLSFGPGFHDGLHRMKFYKVVDNKGNRKVLPEWYGSKELLMECSKRSLPEYQKMLQKNYLQMLKKDSK